MTLPSNTATRSIYTECARTQVNFYQHSNTGHPIRISSLNCFIKSIVHLPKVAVPFPVLSKSWKATMKRASGAHSTDSKARNSWKEINLMETNRLTAYILWTLHSTSLALRYWMMRGYHSLITASRRQTKKGSTYFHCEHLTLEWFVQL